MIHMKVRNPNRQLVAEMFFFLTANWKCGIRQTTALNLPVMLHYVHYDGHVDCDGVGRIKIYREILINILNIETFSVTSSCRL